MNANGENSNGTTTAATVTAGEPRPANTNKAPPPKRGLLDLPTEILERLIPLLPIYPNRHLIWYDKPKAQKPAPDLANLARSCKVLYLICRPRLADACASVSFAYQHGPWRKMWDLIVEESISDASLAPLGDWRGLVKHLDIFGPAKPTLPSSIPSALVFSQFTSLKSLWCSFTSDDDVRKLGEARFPYIEELNIGWDFTSADKTTDLQVNFQMPSLKRIICRGNKRKPILDKILARFPHLERVEVDFACIGASLQDLLPAADPDTLARITHIRCDDSSRSYMERLTRPESRLAPTHIILSGPDETKTTDWRPVVRMFDNFQATRQVKYLYAHLGTMEQLKDGFPGASWVDKLVLRTSIQHRASHMGQISFEAREALFSFRGSSLAIAISLPRVCDAGFFGDNGGGKRRTQEFAEFLDFWIRELPEIMKHRRITYRIAFGPAARSIVEIPSGFVKVLKMHKLLDSDFAQSAKKLDEAIARAGIKLDPRVNRLTSMRNDTNEGDETWIAVESEKEGKLVARAVTFSWDGFVRL